VGADDGDPEGARQLLQRVAHAGSAAGLGVGDMCEGEIE
jgi:hypothetical protein